MSIRQRLEDAQLLIANRRYEGALLSYCAAISATSRKRYMDRNQYNDRVAFTTFLGEEMPVVTNGIIRNIMVKCYEADTAKYPDQMMPLQDVLYEFVRCTLAHESRIGESVEFEHNDSISFNVTDTRLILGGGVANRLSLVVQFAPENVDEFPEIAHMPIDVVGWFLFNNRRNNLHDYLEKRQHRMIR